MSDALRHGTTEELLALRDGEGSAWSRSHALACAECAAELRRLEQVRARRERRGRFTRSAVGLATAAALTALTFVSLRPSSPDVAAERATLQRAMVRSSALEQALKALQPERQSLPGDAALVAAELHERLSQLDVQLAAPTLRERGRAIDLWQERAGVLSALVDVHTTRVAAVSF